MENKNTGKYQLSDSFESNDLGSQWRFFKEFGADRYQLTGDEIVVNGIGNAVPNCSPMLIVPTNHSYTASLELVIEGDAIGGIVLFYNENGYSGILANKTNILTNLRGWQFATKKNAICRKVFLCLKNIENTVDMYYSLDGKEWLKTENSFEVSAYHHNILNSFMSLRIGLCAMGDGKVIFKDFKYTAID